MLLDLLLLLVLILLSGIFAMSEIALVSSRRARLQQMAQRGSAGAQRAVALAAEPTRFLSSVQIGITMIGILTGAIGEDAIAARLRTWLDQVPAVAAYADTISLVLMVALVTYASLILGELVPKRLALTQPERIASLMARPMGMVATVARPLVRLLSATTDGVIRLLGVRQVKRPEVTVDELRVMLKQGAEEGVFEPAEQRMATNVLGLDERHVDEVLTPRSEIVFLDIGDDPEENRDKIRRQPHDVLPLCEGGLDHVIGVVRSTRVLERVLGGGELDLRAIAEQPVFVPERMTLMRLLGQFQHAHARMALVVDEFGDVEGLVSLTDVMTAIVGEVPAEPVDEMLRRREDGTWLADGALELHRLIVALNAGTLLTQDEREHYHTIGGLAMAALGRVPRMGDVFERGGYRFEVVDMDGNRVDRVLVGPAVSR